ncbi:MAG TPA: hypothetical protein VN729_12655 [Ktedonobacteraceae bacterium]|nr:hypothetical protein [Ktedonobacteraceae bacterium]
MRCPYCGGLNQERAAFCVSCGRDLRRPLPNAQPPRSQAPQQPVYPANPTNQPANRGASQPTQQPRPAAPAPTRTAQPAAPASRRSPAPAARASVPPPFQAPAPLSAPEAPGPFPPRTMAQFNALLVPGVQPYTVVESSLVGGKKKLVRIAFSPSAGWQQAVTLLQALRDLPDEKLDTIIVQGVWTQQPDVYAFTNGQLQFDRNVRLGGQLNNRYIVETGNGFASDSVRFVLNE